MKTANELAKLADKYYQTREKRLAAQRAVDVMKEDEEEMREDLMLTLEGGEVKSVGGKVCRVTLVIQDEPTVEDWDKLYSHIKKTGAFELLYRRVNSKAVKERWDEKVKVPGIGKVPVTSLSVNKV